MTAPEAVDWLGESYSAPRSDTQQDHGRVAGPTMHAPTLQRSGTFSASSAATAQHLDERALPSQIEIPVGRPPREHGRIIVNCSDAEVSIEERRTAAAMAAALGRLLGPPDH